jgi:hypothetical protein
MFGTVSEYQGGLKLDIFKCLELIMKVSFLILYMHIF